MSGVLADVMQTCPPCVDAGVSLKDLAACFEQSRAERVLVVRDGKLVGAVCAVELARSVCFCSEKTAGDVAGRHVLTARESTPIAKAFHAFKSGVDRIVVVLRDQAPVGCVRPVDLFGWSTENVDGNAMRRPHLMQREAASEDTIRTAG